MSVHALLNGQSLIPVVAVDNEAQALGLAQALIDGGINTIEITLRSDYGVKAVHRVKKEFPDMVVLAGTVTSLETMRAVCDAGADGVISPGMTHALLDCSKELGIPYLPGVATASEILLAMEYGLQECKLFPASIAGGIPALKAFSGPYAGMKFCPTGGVGESNYLDYLALPNVMCVGGSWLCPGDLIESENWDGISELTRKAVAGLA